MAANNVSTRNEAANESSIPSCFSSHLFLFVLGQDFGKSIL